MAGNRDTFNLTEQTVASLQEMVAQSGLGPGEPFAVEADLEKKLNVSRVVLREAVSRLRALGILQSRQGVGLIVSKPDPVMLFEQAIAGYALDSVDIAQLAELRYCIEIGAVELAVTRAVEGQLARLTELAEELAECHAGRSSGRVINDVELDFHSTMLQATHSPMVMRMHRVLAVFFVRSVKETDLYPVDETTERSAWEHRVIAEAFRQRSVERARALLAGHLSALLSIQYHQPDSTDNTGE